MLDASTTAQAEAFRDWILDPARGSEELFLAELIIETLEKNAPDSRSFELRHEAQRRRERRRALTPGYRPRLTRARIEAATAYWNDLKKIDHQWHEDRPVRDLAALRFVPELQELQLLSELRDLEGLAAVPDLQVLALRDERLTDLRGLRHVPRLKRANLSLSHPWPEPAGLECLERSEDIDCRFTLCLDAVPAWPAVIRCKLGIHGGYPLKNLRLLPAMPALRSLNVSTASLDGIERYPMLEKLEAQGIFEDLSPLAASPRLRELTLHGEHFEDLAPVARVPNLYRLHLARERGLLLDPLLEAARLRVVEAPSCRVIATELASLNAAIAWGPQDFELDQPRPLPPPRVFLFRRSDPETDAALAVPEAPDERERVAGDDPTFEPSEDGWLKARLTKALDVRFRPGWGEVLGGMGRPMVLIHRDVERQMTWEVLDALREVLAIARFPVTLTVGFTDPIDDSWEKQERDEDEYYFETEEEREDRRRQLREERAYRDREHLHRLGVPVPDTDPLEDEEPLPEAEPEETGDEATEDDETYEAPDSIYLTLTLAHIWVNDKRADEARYFLNVEPEDWHALPEPPTSRPRPTVD